jgi:hypothetical protein
MACATPERDLDEELACIYQTPNDAPRATLRRQSQTIMVDGALSSASGLAAGTGQDLLTTHGANRSDRRGIERVACALQNPFAHSLGTFCCLGTSWYRSGRGTRSSPLARASSVNNG